MSLNEDRKGQMCYNSCKERGAFVMKKILRNRIRCRLCGDVIESTDRHEYVKCSCGQVTADGGTDDLRRSFKGSREDFEELSEFEEDLKQKID